jgi:hypothetical protein
LALDDYEFNLNSLFDPNLTGTGHQPLGRDQWSTFYSRYRVLRCQYQVDIVNTSSSPLRVVVTPTDAVTALTILSAPEQPGAQRRLIGPSTGFDTFSFRGTVDLATLTGRSPTEYLGSDLAQAQFSSNPGDAAILHVFGASTDGTNVTYGVDVRLLYDTILFDRVELADS